MKNRPLYDMVSASDARKIESLYTTWTPSAGFDVLATKLSAIEGDFAQVVAWAMFSGYHDQIIGALMKER